MRRCHRKVLFVSKESQLLKRWKTRILNFEKEEIRTAKERKTCVFGQGQMEDTIKADKQSRRRKTLFVGRFYFGRIDLY